MSNMSDLDATISALSPEALFQLYQELEPRVMEATFPRAAFTVNVEAERRLACPHCWNDDVRALEIAESWQGVRGIDGGDPDPVTIYFDADHDHEFQTLCLYCPECNRPLSEPEGTEVEWS